jgi:putative tryptophan/tyrosine transport system substrate-binding protein
LAATLIWYLNMQEAARTRGVKLSIHLIARSDEIASAIDTANASGATALNVLASPLFCANRQAILDRVAALHLPTMHEWPETAELGGFVAYGPRLVQLFRDPLARQLVQLLRGVEPADIPVEQPTKFELVIHPEDRRSEFATKSKLDQSVMLEGGRS